MSHKFLTLVRIVTNHFFVALAREIFLSFIFSMILTKTSVLANFEGTVFFDKYNFFFLCFFQNHCLKIELGLNT